MSAVDANKKHTHTHTHTHTRHTHTTHTGQPVSTVDAVKEYTARTQVHKHTERVECDVCGTRAPITYASVCTKMKKYASRPATNQR